MRLYSNRKKVRPERARRRKCWAGGSRGFIVHQEKRKKLIVGAESAHIRRRLKKKGGIFHGIKKTIDKPPSGKTSAKKKNPEHCPFGRDPRQKGGLRAMEKFCMRKAVGHKLLLLQE